MTWPPEPFIRRKLEGLAARGFRVTVATHVRPGPGAHARLNGVELRRLPQGRSPMRVLPRVVFDAVAMAGTRPGVLRALIRSVLESAPGGRSGRWRHAIRRLHAFLPVARVDPDVVHFEWNDWAVDYLPLVRAWDRPVVVSCRGSAVSVRPLLPAGGEYSRALSETFELAAAVHSVSDAMATQGERYGLDRSKVCVIRPAVDPAFFAPLASRTPGAEGFRIAAVGLLRWQKGYEYAVIALRDLIDQGVPARLDIIGPEPLPGPVHASDRDRLLHAIGDLALDGNVRLLAATTPEGVREHLRRSHVFLHPSVVEGLPNVVLEAMACGLPVVVTDAGGTREAVRDGVEGFVVKPRDPRALAVALHALWHNDELRERFGLAGRRRVEAEFALAEQTSRFEALYRGVVEEPTAAA